MLFDRSFRRIFIRRSISHTFPPLWDHFFHPSSRFARCRHLGRLIISSPYSISFSYGITIKTKVNTHTHTHIPHTPRGIYTKCVLFSYTVIKMAVTGYHQKISCQMLARQIKYYERDKRFRSYFLNADKNEMLGLI